MSIRHCSYFRCTASAEYLFGAVVLLAVSFGAVTSSDSAAHQLSHSIRAHGITNQQSAGTANDILNLAVLIGTEQNSKSRAREYCTCSD